MKLLFLLIVVAKGKSVMDNGGLDKGECPTVGPSMTNFNIKSQINLSFRCSRENNPNFRSFGD